MASFEAIFTNKNNITDHFVDYWDYVSKYFSESPYVIGFDPFNEPFPGEIFKNLWFLIPGHADYYRLEPLYTKL